jgi:hypothetical protein
MKDMLILLYTGFREHSQTEVDNNDPIFFLSFQVPTFGNTPLDSSIIEGGQVIYEKSTK